MNTILVAGAAGFIGSNLTIKLLELGHRVIGFDNFSYGTRENITSFQAHENFTFIEGDLNDYSIIEPINCDCIVHLASQKIPRYDNAYKTLSDNSNLTKNMVKHALQISAKLVFASTSDVYGKNPKMPFSETSDLVLGPTDNKRWAYAVSKIHSEQFIIANAAEHGLEYTIMRFFGSYGPNQNTTWWGGPQSVFIDKAFKKETMEVHGDGLQTRTFTYVDDTVQGIVKCIFENRSKNEVFNIAGNPDTEISILDLAKLIWGMINPGLEVKIKFIPYASFGNYEDVRRRVPNIDKISSLLQFSPQWDLTEGMIKAIAWQKQL